MNTSGSEIKIISGNSNKELAEKIAENIGVKFRKKHLIIFI